MPTRQVLRLGVYQLYKMRIPNHAAVYETVNIAGPARTLVNAVLRKTIAEKDAYSSATPGCTGIISAIRIRSFSGRNGSLVTEVNSRKSFVPGTMSPRRFTSEHNRLRVTPGELI